MKTVLVVEESPDLLKLLLEMLPRLFPDWRMVGALNPQQADEIYRSRLLSLAIIEVSLGKDPMAGVALLRRWRADGAGFPIVFTTSMRSLFPTLMDAGPDDVLLKPWDSFEIKARFGRIITAGEKRAPTRSEAPRADGIRIREAFTFAGATITPDFLCQFPDGHVGKLGAKEYGILASLADARGRVLTRESLLQEVWGAGADTSSNSVNVYLSRLRKRFTGHGCPFDDTVVTEAKIGWRIAS